MELEHIIENQMFDEERALYHIMNTLVKDCVFAGEQDGESVLKETRSIKVENCQFSLRYPLWHVQEYELIHSKFDNLSRAPIWYSSYGMIDSCHITGIKTLRECKETIVKNCKIDSPEFGWKCHGVTIEDSIIQSEYFLLDSENVKVNHLNFSGKYSFQYIQHLEINDSYLDTKDAFWHSRDIVVRNSVLKGEYLGWFSENLTLINCKIIGTQPLCYCKNLKLVNCVMVDTDLAFEYSEVEAEIIGNVKSIKNPKSGHIIVDSVDDIIFEDAVIETQGEVILRK